MNNYWTEILLEIKKLSLLFKNHVEKSGDLIIIQFFIIMLKDLLLAKVSVNYCMKQKACSRSCATGFSAKF